MNRRGDVAVAQRKPVAAMRRERLICKTGFVQRAKKPVARRVAGENATGAIAAVRGGREAENEQPRIFVAEARNRSAPINPVAKLAFFFARDALAIFDESRAKCAANDARVDRNNAVARRIVRRILSVFRWKIFVWKNRRAHFLASFFPITRRSAPRFDCRFLRPRAQPRRECATRCGPKRLLQQTLTPARRSTPRIHARRDASGDEKA